MLDSLFESSDSFRSLLKGLKAGLVMRKLKLLIAVAALTALATGARAETIYTLNATLQDGGVIGSVLYDVGGYPYLSDSSPNATPPFSFTVTGGFYNDVTFSAANNGNGSGPIWSPNTVFDFYPNGAYGPELQLSFLGDLLTGPATLVTGIGNGSFICGTVGGYLCGNGPVDYLVSGSVTVTTTPLPSTWIMFIAGLGGLGLMITRSRRNSAVAQTA